MQIRNNTLITECSAYDFKEMLERKKVKSWLKSVSAFANTEASSFFTTFYNLNWGKNERIPVEEVAERVNSPLKKYPANEESSVEKFGVNADKFGDTSETQKKVSKTAQKIIDRTFFVYRILFEGTIYPVGYFFNRHSSVVTPVQIIECGVERSRFRLILRLFTLQEIG